MVEVTHSLLSEERLRACFVPAMFARDKPWHVTITRKGELFNSLDPVELRPTVLLDCHVLQQLDDALASLDVDYTPSSVADGVGYRTMTYRVDSKIRHIMIVDGVSAEFTHRKQFNVVWKILSKLAALPRR